MAELGFQFIFTGYDIQPPDGEMVFQRGDLGVIAAFDDDDGAFRCFGLDQGGHLIPAKGDTLFQEEMILLVHAPKVCLGGDEE